MALQEESVMSVSLTHIRLVVRGCLLELWRRQDVWIFAMLMGIFTLVALTARFSGETTAATGTFMLNLGMSLAVLFSHGLTVLLAVRQFPDEIENRTLYPLLAKPLSRDSLLLGKWLACFLGGMLSLLVFQVIVFVVSPPPQPTMMLMHLQHMISQILSLGWAAALGLFLSLFLPRALALGTSLLLVFASESLFRWMEPRLSWLPNLLPRFGALNLATRVTDGITPLSFSGFSLLLLYALFWTILCLSGSRAILLRRAL
jgi:ABC-type transport system involved in multi-copper enzyme maturation permease subunit